MTDLLWAFLGLGGVAVFVLLARWVLRRHREDVIEQQASDILQQSVRRAAESRRSLGNPDYGSSRRVTIKPGGP